MIKTPIRTAVVGIGGFGFSHHNALRQLEEQGIVKVVATCDPRWEQLTGERADQAFESRGVSVYGDFEAMLAAHEGELDLVTVAAPIGFHAPMHSVCVERGLACYLEKPPTLDPDELDQMIAVDAKATFKTQIGFNYVYQPYRHQLREEIRSGRFGAFKGISLLAEWPRDLWYYGRNNWAGKLLLGNYILLDSVCGNAASHHLQNVLFFADYAQPATIEAELYRANAIEGADVIFARGTLENGGTFRIAATHASGAGRHSTVETIECEKATIHIYPVDQLYKIVWADGRVEEHQVPKALLFDNMKLFCQTLQRQVERPPVTLEDCRPFVNLNALLYVGAGKITPIPSASYRLVQSVSRPDYQLVGVEGISEILEKAANTGAFPSEQGVAWAAAGGRASAADLPKLRSTLEAMRAAACVEA